MDKQKIILIEDDILLNDMYKQTLTNAGYAIISAMDGESGLSSVRSNTDANLILLDLMLPKLNGIEVLKEIKKDPSTNKISIIVLTNLNEQTIVQDALKLGANAYLVKVDYTPDQVIGMVKQYIDLKSQIKENGKN